MATARKKARSQSATVEKKKQAVVVIHGMDEQIPLDTLRGFVNTVWVTDETVISRTRLDSNNGQQRIENPVWEKPDRHSGSFDVRRMTTEEDINGVRTDFIEFCWAHMLPSTTWGRYKIWFTDLLWRAPKRIPNDIFGAWIAIWLVTGLAGLTLLASLLPIGEIHRCLTGNCDAGVCVSSNLCWRWLSPLAGFAVWTLATAAIGFYLLKYFGRIARYIKTTPVNTAQRQDIQKKGVELFEALMGVGGFDPSKHKPGAPYPKWNTPYDRIIVVSHSLGTVIAYDILKASFARVNRYINRGGQARRKQPHRHELEKLIQGAIEHSGTLDIEAFRRLQNLALQELKADGSPWIVSDFITLGSPLAHAEFFLAEGEQDLRAQQEKRILPTCPPALEWDEKSGHQHFTYRYGSNFASGEYFRYPHPAAHFAFTRWTNIYSKSRNFLWGDIISGPVSGRFGLSTPVAQLQGILDIPVLPEQDFEDKAKGVVPFFTHCKYWDMSVRTGPNDSWAIPYHIHKLREVLNLSNT